MSEERKMELSSKMSIMSLNLPLDFWEIALIKMAAHKFSGKLIVCILLLLFSFMLIEVFK